MNFFIEAAIYLGSDIPFSSCTTGFRFCKVDGDFKHGKGQLEINGHMYQKGMVIHANGKARFNIGRKYFKLSSCIGISKYTGNAECGVTRGEAKFRVVGDNVVLRDWELKSSPGDPTCFDVDVTDVQELILEVDSNGSYACDMAAWADAKVIAKVYSIKWK